MNQTACAAAITIRAAVSGDADGITSAFLASAEHHASLDPERYWVPPAEMISARYREGQQHPPSNAEVATTLVAALSGEIVGFIDVRLEKSSDPMHRDIIYCHIAEIAVNPRHQKQGVGRRLLCAAEDWGRQRGAEFACLEYHRANVRTSIFYQRAMDYRVVSVTAIKRLSQG